MSYESLDEDSNARSFDDFHDAKVEVLKSLNENDSINAAVALGNMVAQFEMLWQSRNILIHKLKKTTNS